MGAALGLLFAFLVAAMDTVNGRHPYLEIMLPGFVVGAIIGFLTQRMGTVRPAIKENYDTPACLVIAVMISISAVAQSDPWAVLRVFEGKWEGPVRESPERNSAPARIGSSWMGTFYRSATKPSTRPFAGGQAPDPEDLGFLATTQPEEVRMAAISQ